MNKVGSSRRGMGKRWKGDEMKDWGRDGRGMGWRDGEEMEDWGRDGGMRWTHTYLDSSVPVSIQS